MTCIVGITDGTTSYIGGDSFGSNGRSGTILNNKKVFKYNNNENIILGYTTSFRMGQLIQYSECLFDELSIIKNYVDEKYMINTFIPNLQSLLNKGGFERICNNEKTGGNFIIAIKNKIFEVQDDYSILSPKDNFCSVGCGYMYANAVLYTLRNSDLTPQEKIIKALEAAEYFSTGVKRPFYVINTNDDDIIEIQ